MFGLFSSKTKKIEEKLSKLAIEIASIQKSIIRKLSNEYKVSEYVLSKSEQKILDKILIEYKVKVKIKV
jgi:hypothetical protein